MDVDACIADRGLLLELGDICRGLLAGLLGFPALVAFARSPLLVVGASGKLCAVQAFMHTRIMPYRWFRATMHNVVHVEVYGISGVYHTQSLLVSLALQETSSSNR